MKNFNELINEGEKFYSQKYEELQNKLRNVKSQEEVEQLVIELTSNRIPIPKWFKYRWFDNKGWELTSNFIGGTILYAVCRVIDPSKPVHSGNLEFATHYMPSKEKAQKMADELNAGNLLDEFDEDSRIPYSDFKIKNGDVNLWV